MIKVNVMYPYAEGARFDHSYYREQHMPMVKARLGDACAYYTVEKGLAGRGAGTPPAFVAMCAFYCASIEGYVAAMQAHGAARRHESVPACLRGETGRGRGLVVEEVECLAQTVARRAQAVPAFQRDIALPELAKQLGGLQVIQDGLDIRRGPGREAEAFAHRAHAV